MQIRTDVVDGGGMRLTVTYGPTLVSVIFDPDDEQEIMQVIQDGFRDAREQRAGQLADGNGHVHSQ